MLKLSKLPEWKIAAALHQNMVAINEHLLRACNIARSLAGDDFPDPKKLSKYAQWTKQLDEAQYSIRLMDSPLITGMVIDTIDVADYCAPASSFPFADVDFLRSQERSNWIGRLKWIASALPALLADFQATRLSDNPGFSESS